MQKFIQQSDGQCDQCQAEIPKGQFIYVDGYENLLCEACGSEQAEEDELNLLGDEYGN